jgi:hypothetical protein
MVFAGSLGMLHVIGRKVNNYFPFQQIIKELFYIRIGDKRH